MKKADLVDAIAGKSGAPKAQVQQLVEDAKDLEKDIYDELGITTLEQQKTLEVERELLPTVCEGCCDRGCCVHGGLDIPCFMPGSTS